MADISAVVGDLWDAVTVLMVSAVGRRALLAQAGRLVAAQSIWPEAVPVARSRVDGRAKTARDLPAFSRRNPTLSRTIFPCAN
jgi:hypothetical protein